MPPVFILTLGLSRHALATSAIKVLPKLVLKGTNSATSSRYMRSTVDEVSRTNQVTTTVRTVPLLHILNTLLQVRVVFPRPPDLPNLDGIAGRAQGQSAAETAAGMVSALRGVCFGPIDQRAHARPWVGISYQKPQEASPVIVPNQGKVILFPSLSVDEMMLDAVHACRSMPWAVSKHWQP